MNPKISIVIPNYNHALFLKERLDSVFKQTFQDFEVILLDDASTDNSCNLLKLYAEHPKVSHVIFNSHNSGSTFKQWQKGIKLSKGDYIWIAESDDYCKLNFLEKIMMNLEKGTDMCYCQSYDVNEQGVILKSRLSYTDEFEPNIWKNDFTMKGSLFNSNYLLVKNVIPNASAIVFKKRLVKKYFFDSTLVNMKMCGDWLFWMRLCDGNSIGFISDQLNYFRNHKNISRVHDTINKKKLRLEEEGQIRREAYLKWNFINNKKDRLLYRKWYDLHNLLDVFSSHFYVMNLPQASRKKFILDFLKLKVKKKQVP